MRPIFYSNFVRALIALALAATFSIPASADGSARDFVRSQSAKAAFITDVSNIAYMAGEMNRYNTYAVMRMTHTHWKFPEDAILKANYAASYAYEIRSTADRVEYDGRQIERAIARNKSVSDDQQATAIDMLELLRRMAELSYTLGELYDQEDITAAGNHYYTELVPVYEAIRRGQITLSSELSREIKLDALKFKD